ALPRGIGKTTLLSKHAGLEHTLPLGAREKILQFKNLLQRIKETAETKPASEVIAFVISEGGFKTHFEEKGGEEGEERLQNLYELFSLSEKYNLFPPGESIEMLLCDAALASDQDDLEKNDNAVRLMTVHASKGLEFDYVFISGLEEGLFPHERAQDGRNRRKRERSIEEDEEERRLFYVALTRARKKLFLSYTASRNVFGEKRWNFPSQFIGDISPDLFEEPPEKPGKVLYLDD
ncbi:MAG: ATP-dependent helicase, partial [Patescibacteria group bacterium]